MPKKWTAAELIELLRAKHDRREWVFVTEVPNGTGSKRSRAADAMAMGVWKKSEFRLHGFEVKVSRSDWQAELNDLNKSESFEKVCHYWWLVAPENIVRPGELPSNWGWLKPGRERLNVASRPILNENAKLNYHFFAAILRKVVNTQSAAALHLAKVRNEAFDRGYASCKARMSDTNQARELDRAKRKLESLDEVVKLIRETTGYDPCVSEYQLRNVLEAAAVMERKPKPANYIHQMRQVEAMFTRLARQASEDIVQVEQLLKLWPDQNQVEKES